MQEYEVAEEAGRLRPKYTQIRPDQWTALDDLARELQDAKSVKGGDRITANTLIRVGIDVVLALAGEVAGDTEMEIRKGLFDRLNLSEQEDSNS